MRWANGESDGKSRCGSTPSARKDGTRPCTSSACRRRLAGGSAAATRSVLYAPPVVKRTAIILLVGAVVGAVIASLVGPPLYAWYNRPALPLPPGFDLDPIIREVIHDFRLIQLAGALLGAVLAVAAFVAFFRGRKKEAPDAPETTSAPSPAPVDPPVH